MNATLVVALHELSYRRVSFFVRLKLVSRKALVFKDRMERLDVRIFVGCFAWDTFMFHAQLPAHLCESFAYELWSVVGADNDSTHVFSPAATLYVLQG